MNINLISKEAVPEEIFDKIKVSSVEIVVHGTKEKPYFEIKYFDLSDNIMHIGFSSYKLDIVFGYLEKYFDIVDEKTGTDYSNNRNVDDLISRKAVIGLIDELGYINASNHDEFKSNCRMDKIRQAVIELPKTFDKEKVIEELNKISQGLLNYENFSSASWIDVAIGVVEKGGIE